MSGKPHIKAVSANSTIPSVDVVLNAWTKFIEKGSYSFLIISIDLSLNVTSVFRFS